MGEEQLLGCLQPGALGLLVELACLAPLYPLLLCLESLDLVLGEHLRIETSVDQSQVSMQYLEVSEQSRVLILHADSAERILQYLLLLHFDLQLQDMEIQRRDLREGLAWGALTHSSLGHSDLEAL